LLDGGAVGLDEVFAVGDVALLQFPEGMTVEDLIDELVEDGASGFDFLVDLTSEATAVTGDEDIEASEQTQALGEAVEGAFGHGENRQRAGRERNEKRPDRQRAMHG
jgi:hypothetical protein